LREKGQNRKKGKKPKFWREGKINSNKGKGKTLGRENELADPAHEKEILGGMSSEKGKEGEREKKKLPFRTKGRRFSSRKADHTSISPNRRVEGKEERRGNDGTRWGPQKYGVEKG